MAGVDGDRGKLTVLVVTCDGYADLLGPFAALFRRYWPDCPFELVLCGETVAADGFDRTFLAGAGKCWSERAVYALDRIATKYILLLLDDYFLSDTVDTSALRAFFAEAEREDALNYRLCPDPPRAVKNTAYSVSCKAGIWNREFLRNLAAKTGRSAWEFERYGSYMFDPDDPRPILVSKRPEFPFIDAVHKGYWEDAAIALMSANGIGCDFSRRGRPPLRIRAVEALKCMAFWLFPADLIVRLQNAVGVLSRRAFRL
jgi:hypothetical protein